MNRTKLYTIVTVLKKECSDLTESFSKRALTEIVKDKMAQYPHFVNNIDVIVTKCIESMENQLKSTHADQKKLLQDYLECPLAVCGGTKGSWVCDDWKMIR